MATLPQLLNALRGLEPVAASELLVRLKISQPTLSRLVKAAGNHVVRLGRARASRYALAREILPLGRHLRAWRVDEIGQAQPYGTFHLLAGGRFWLEREQGEGEWFSGLPPVLFDMSPCGYLGRTFSRIHADLGLPASIRDWIDDHALIAVARRGEDCAGDLIVGDESFTRFWERSPLDCSRQQYPDLAQSSGTESVGSSAVGEQPKFAVLSEGRSVLVKFAPADRSAASRRWRDLLACEWLALAVLAEAGLATATAHLFDIDGMRFLEMERFDRVGLRGRRGLLSLQALDRAYLGGVGNWTEGARDLLDQGRIVAEDARRMIWLDVFGQLIANDDRHHGNLSFLVDDDSLRLAPVYDMLPMRFAPQGTTVVARPVTPAPPTAASFEVWPEAARWAMTYWDRVAEHAAIGAGFRKLVRQTRKAVARLAEGYL